MPKAHSYATYATTIFLSAFLLFAIQPVAGKHLLPYFGGSSSVWATSLLFFTSMLFLGYLYVYLITRLSHRSQIWIHMTVIAIAAFLAIAALIMWGSPFGEIVSNAEVSSSPALYVLLTLCMAIGAPYFLLSTTGPLLQYWYGSESSREPYKLYSLSNIGSFLALLSYPFLIEPFMPLPREEFIWAILFLAYGALALAICRIHYRVAHTESMPKAEPDRMSILQMVHWTGLAMLPSFLLVAVTTVMTQLIAPIPLLWILPLALYLVSFILAFRGIGQSIYLPLLVLASAGAAFVYTPAAPGDIVPQVVSYLIFLFTVSILAHVRLYAMRPPTPRLPLFYLILSFGGMLGSLFAGMLAPVVFNDFYEFPLGLAIGAALAVSLLSSDFFPRILSERKILITRIAFILAIFLIFFSMLLQRNDNEILSRNFYGSAKVQFSEEVTTLQHGTTLHGIQPTNTEWAYMPTTYYVPASGVGRAIQYEKELRKKNGVNVGIIGLGTGSMAAYCRDTDTFTFYEIDPRIEHIARSYFTYIERCKGSDIRIGDGRILLEQELQSGKKGAYDLIVADAFTDDSIPAHLLTLQAVELYAAHLRSDKSIIAIHVSNRYLDLAPVILRITKEMGWSATIVYASGDSESLASGSEWVLLAKDTSVFESLEFANIPPWEPPQKDAPLWTDDYTSLLSVVNFRLPW